MPGDLEVVPDCQQGLRLKAAGLIVEWEPVWELKENQQGYSHMSLCQFEIGMHMGSTPTCQQNMRPSIAEYSVAAWLVQWGLG